MVKLQRQLYAGCLFSGMGGFASGLIKAGFLFDGLTIMTVMLARRFDIASRKFD